MKLENYIHGFMKTVKNKKDLIYSEICLQFELGFYLRSKLPEEYKVEFERNIQYFDIQKTKDIVKREIDLAVYKKVGEKKEDKTAIELKMPASTKGNTVMIWGMLKDMQFVEQLKENGFADCYCLTYIKCDYDYYCNKCKENTKRTYKRFVKTFKDNDVMPSGDYTNEKTGDNEDAVRLELPHGKKWTQLGKESAYYLDGCEFKIR